MQKNMFQEYSINYALTKNSTRNSWLNILLYIGYAYIYYRIFLKHILHVFLP